MTQYNRYWPTFPVEADQKRALKSPIQDQSPSKTESDPESVRHSLTMLLSEPCVARGPFGKSIANCACHYIALRT
jgi:hypothetical protein